MLNKINHIKNVGRFYDVMPSGTSSSDPSFQRFTLIFAENGTGKSTISSILKSLDSNNPDPILAKTTINGTGPSEVSLKLSNQDYVFVNNAWRKKSDAQILIFDEDFVQRNVFTTSGVDANNKRELFNYVVLGEDNYEKVKELNKITEDLAALKKEISPLENLLKKSASIDDIAILLKTKKITEEELKQLEKSIEEIDTQIKSSEQIKKQAKIEKISNLDWVDPKNILEKDIEVIGDLAEYKCHIQKHQDWLQTGQKIQGENTSCPYCFQDTSNSAAIKAYKQYFSEACQNLIKEVSSLNTSCANEFTNDKISLILKTVKSNATNLSFWHKVSKEISLDISFDEDIENKIKQYRSTLHNVIKNKMADTLSKVVPTVEEQENLNLMNEINELFGNYNKSVESENQKIQKLKDQQLKIDELKNKHKDGSIIIKCNKTAFFDTDTSVSFSDYKTKIHERKKSRERLDTLKKEINQSSIDTLKKYQDSINNFLRFINVDFRIAKVEKRSDSTSKETLIYAIELRGESFDPNGSRGKPYNLSNTLSSGDRSTLAFAFFLAKLEHADLEQTILVFDDPITSLDFFRKQQTSKKIIGLSKRALQTIVLSHSLEFCKLFGHIPVQSKYFKLNKVQSINGVVVTPYNKLKDISTAKHKEDHDKITSFLTDPTSVEKYP